MTYASYISTHTIAIDSRQDGQYRRSMANTPIRTFRCEDEAWNALERIGKDLDRTQAWLVRKAVEEYIERYRAAKRAQKQPEQSPQ
jgi:predicted DNA-binding protein